MEDVELAVFQNVTIDHIRLTESIYQPMFVLMLREALYRFEYFVPQATLFSAEVPA